MTDHAYLVYALIVFFSCIEGPIISVLFGVLIHGGYIPFAPVFIALMLGDVIGDTVWYWVGFRFGHPFINRFGSYIGITEEKVVKTTTIFHRNKDWILIISKITNGFGFSLVTLIAAGIAKIPFGRYLAFNFVGQIVWTGILLFIGYFFSGWYTSIDTWLGRFSVIGLALLVAVAFVGYTRYLRSNT